ncbi:MAG: GNAT family N-acetyltransferase [Clostridia bacterium]|nr:GNAT family N-acetyltransferase [Clostridia bacterium]
MNHIGTQPIETERLMLRRFRAEDAQAMFDNWASDDDVTKFMTWRTYRRVEDVSAYIDYVNNNYLNNHYYDWIIELKAIGQPIGSISAVNMDERIGWVEIGYCIGKRWWHQGIMTEALSAVIAFLFDEVGMNRVEARHDVRNPHSGDVMRKCGLQYEGTLRQRGWNNQGVGDMSYYGILRAEYHKG